MSRELRIVYLEDVATDAELLEHELRKEGFVFKLTRVDSRDSFIQALHGLKPDLIISDYAVPAFDGLAALKVAQSIHPDIPFIFISGTLGEERAIETLKHGATDYVLKDRLSRLAPVVRRALKEARELSRRKEIEDALIKSEELFRRIIETAQEGVWTVNTAGETIFANGRIAEMLGYEPEEIMTLKLEEVADPSLPVPDPKQQPQEGQELRLRHKDGSWRWVTMSTTPLLDDLGQQIGLLSMISDITARRLAEEERSKLWAAVETGSDWVLITDRDGTIEYVNRAVERISGYRKKEILGQNSRMFKSEKQEPALYTQMWKRILSGKPFRSLIINRKKDGALFYLDLTITPLRDGNSGIVSFVATGKDISEKKLLEERLHYLAYSDMLTGLANRSLFFDRLQQAITMTVSDNKLVVIAIVDLQRFKYINETFGVEAGDEILREVGRRLLDTLRPSDTVARYGGDSFGLILPEVREMRDAILVVEKVTTSLSRPYKCGQDEIINTFSIGIATCPTDSSDTQLLIRYAEAALFKAKEKRGNSYRFYTPGMNIIANNFLAMEKNLYHALAANEFVLQYQPYFDMQSGELKGMEALIRWRRKDGRLTLPGEFVPILEETGQILAVGDWVIKTACEQIAEWRAQGHPLVPVSVNLSPTQFRQENLVAQMLARLAACDVPAELLIIEITENIFVSNLEYTRHLLETFQAQGLRLSIDDFGTGYSSLSYLAGLPLNNLKIDFSFVVNIVHEPKAFSIAKVIISMAHELGMKTIAEGVEYPEQQAILKQLGCDLAQGFYYSRSLPGDEIGPLLQAGHVTYFLLPTI